MKARERENIAETYKSTYISAAYYPLNPNLVQN